MTSESKEVNANGVSHRHTHPVCGCNKVNKQKLNKSPIKWCHGSPPCRQRVTGPKTQGMVPDRVKSWSMRSLSVRAAPTSTKDSTSGDGTTFPSTHRHYGPDCYGHQSRRATSQRCPHCVCLTAHVWLRNHEQLHITYSSAGVRITNSGFVYQRRYPLDLFL